MIDPAALDAADILAIAEDDPECLFPADAAAARAAYHTLARRWHPDRAPGAAAVFARIGTLYRLAAQRRAGGWWRCGGVLDVTAADGRGCRLRYRRRHDFELGEMYVATSAVAFVVRPDHGDLVEAALDRLAGFRFASPAMAEEIRPALPELAGLYRTRGDIVVVMRKAPDLVLLADLAACLGGALPPRHVAWVLSVLYNLACYFEVAGLTHNALGATTLFVSPQRHWGAVLGGWWYAVPAGAPLRALPAWAAAEAAEPLLLDRRADPCLDLDLIRALGRDLLGTAADVPRPLAQWLGAASAGRAREDYRQWRQVLEQSFGPRAFTPLPLTPEDIYS